MSIEGKIEVLPDRVEIKRWIENLEERLEALEAKTRTVQAAAGFAKPAQPPVHARHVLVVEDRGHRAVLRRPGGAEWFSVNLDDERIEGRRSPMAGEWIENLRALATGWELAMHHPAGVPIEDLVPVVEIYTRVAGPREPLPLHRIQEVAVRLAATAAPGSEQELAARRILAEVAALAAEGGSR